MLPFFIEKTSAVEQILREFFCEHPVFCVSGEKSSTDFIVGAVLSAKKQSEKESREFDLMESHGTVRDISMEGYRFRSCTRDDSDFLYPLQVSYIKEEVLPDGMELNLPAERLKLECHPFGSSASSAFSTKPVNPPAPLGYPLLKRRLNAKKTY